MTPAQTVCPHCGRPYEEAPEAGSVDQIADEYCQLVAHHTGAKRIGPTWREKFGKVFATLMESYTADDLMTLFAWLDKDGYDKLQFGLLSIPTGRFQHALLRQAPALIAKARAWRKAGGR